MDQFIRVYRYLPVDRGIIWPEVEGFVTWMTIMSEIVPPVKGMLHCCVQARSISYGTHDIVRSIFHFLFPTQIKEFLDNF